MYRSRSLQHFLPPLLLTVSLAAVYLSTLAPGLTWANDGSDGGDLIAAAATGGVPHPTGYPLYLLLARVFQFLPVGSLAFRTNLLSAIATALAAGVVYALVANSSTRTKETYDWPAGLVAGYAFGLAPLIWSQAVITEVYGVQALLASLILYLYSLPAGQSASARARLDLWRGLLLGIAMGNHSTTILLVPAALLLGSFHSQIDDASTPDRFSFGKRTLDQGALLRQLGMFAAGLALYLMIPLRALTNPPINWGNAVTPGRFWWLVSGQLYRSYYLQFDPTALVEHIRSAASLLLEQFGFLGVVFGIVGVILFRKSSHLFILTAWTASVYTLFAVLYGSHDSYVYLIPAFLSFAIWIGVSIRGLSDRFARGSFPLRIGFALLLVGYLAIRSLDHVRQLDASTDMRAESFGRDVLSAAPEDAILFATGDDAVFALWYFHFALGERPDVAVLAVDLLHFDWYEESLHSTYPSLVIPASFLWPETVSAANPARPVCYVRYEEDTVMECSQLTSPH